MHSMGNSREAQPSQKSSDREFQMHLNRSQNILKSVSGGFGGGINMAPLQSKVKIEKYHV